MKDQYFYPTDEFDNHIAEIMSDEKYNDTLYQGKIVTGEAFISSEGRDKIIEEHNPLCVDMETTSIAHVCYANKMPFFAIRTITDTEEYCGNKSFEENLEMASRKSLSILKDLLDKI
jgi:adenosylhomocysteine nucleosidase